MLFRKAALILTILLILGAFGFGVWLWKSQNRLYSSPTAVRTNIWYTRAQASSSDVTPAPTNLYSLFQIDRNTTNRIVISYPPSSSDSSEKDYGPINIIHADSNHVAKVGDGTIRLAYIGVGTIQPITNLNEGNRVPATYYTADAKPLPASDNAPRMIPHYDRSLWSDVDYPTAQFVFARTNIDKIKTLRFHAFDARTHYPLTSGYSSSSAGDGFFFNTTLQLWHQTPIDVVATLAVGPVQSYTFAATEGAEIKYPGGQIRLLLKSENDLGGWSSTQHGSSNTVTFQIRPPYATVPPRKSCSFLFHSWPQAHARPIDFEFIDANGKTLPGMRSSTSGPLMVAVAEGTLDQVKEIRLKHYPNVYRITYTIPELPGLPEQNRNLENLFDVHIPYMFFRYEYGFQHSLGRLLQMDQSHFALTFPNAYFPTVRSNTSTRALFLEVESLLSDPELQLVADPEKNEIRTRPHPVRAAIEAIKNKLGI